MLPPDDPRDFPSRAEIFGLATLAGHASTRRDLRIKAIRALARIPEQNAIHVLGEMALWEEDEELRSEAYRSLEATFGDDLPEVLEGIRRELTGDWGQGSSDDEDEGEEEAPAQSAFEATPGGMGSGSAQGPREEGTPLWLLWAILGAAILVGLAIVLLAR